MPDELVTPAPRLLPALGWIGGLVAALGGALALGDVPALAAPPLTRPAELAAWAAGRAPLEAAFAVLRLVVLVLACYLLVVTALAVALRLGRAGRLVTALDVVTLPWVRAVVHGALGVGLAGATLAGVGSAAGGRAAEPPTALTAGEAGPSQPGAAAVDTGDLLVRLPEAGVGAPTMARLVALEEQPPPSIDEGPPSSEGPPEVSGYAPVLPDHEDPQGDRVAPPAGEGSDAPEPADGASSEPGSAGGGAPAGALPDGGLPDVGAEVALAAGDHLWAVAERTLAGARGAAPADAEVTAYWRALVDANQGRLADPSNPDLVFPGQVLVLPDLPVR
jgi:nucleoid-associated protein YgaU